MSFCGGTCGRKINKQIKVDKEIQYLSKKTSYEPHEIRSLRDRFYQISGPSLQMDIIQFRENMGILGLETTSYLSDRIFQMLANENNKVYFIDFVMFLNIHKNGDEHQRHELSFKLIDCKNKGYFNFDDLFSLFSSLTQIWCAITGNQITDDSYQKLRKYTQIIFDQLDVNKNSTCELQEFLMIVEQNPNILEIFDFLNKGIKDTFNIQNNNDNEIEKELCRNLLKTQMKIQSIITLIQRDIVFDVQIQNEIQEPQKLNNSLQPMNFQQQQNNFDQKDLKKNQVYLASSFVIEDNLKLSEIKIDQNDIIQVNDEKNNFKHKRKNIFAQNEPKKGEQLFISIIQQLETPKKKIDMFDSQFFSKNKILETNSVIYNTLQQSYQKSFQKKDKFIQVTQVVNFDEENDDQENEFEVELEQIMPKLESPNFSKKRKLSFLEKLHEDFDDFQQRDPKYVNRFSEQPENQLQQNNINFHRRMSLNNKLHQENKNVQKIDNSSVSVRQIIKKVVNLLKEVNQETEEIRQTLELKTFQQNLQNQEQMEQKEQKKSQIALNIPKKKIKKSMKSVTFGDENFNLVLNMMIGIRMSAKSIFMSNDYVLSNKDFKLKYYFELIPRRTKEDEGKQRICKFNDYAPYVFYELRRMQGINVDQYLKSIGPENLLSSIVQGKMNSLSEFMSSGKSGSFFYYSMDGKYTLKTIKFDEKLLLKKILKDYYQHSQSYPNSLITKFYGLHKIKHSNQKIYFLIMENVFSTFNEIHERFDIKGSLYQRHTDDTDPSIAKKDLDLLDKGIKLKISQNIADQLMQQIKVDCEFFQQNNIIDYSLLLGIHHIDQGDNTYQKKGIDHIPSDFKWTDGILSQDGTCIYYMGIIDVLTGFNTIKKLEHSFKLIAYGPTISAIPPAPYAQRFQEFIYNIIEIS